VLVSGGGYASLKTDSTGATPLGNPFTCDANGEKEFWILGGEYQIVVDGGQAWDIILSGASDIQSIATFADLASTPVVAGKVYYLKEYHAGTGKGGGTLEAYTSSDTPNSGTIFASGTAGVRLKRINTEISLSQFGADPTGLADSSSAVNLAIAYANSIGGDDATNITGVTIRIDDGRFLIDSALNPITKSGINFVGSSENGSVLLLKNGTTTFTWGNGGVTTVVGGGISNCKIEYLTAPSATTIAININGAFRLNFSNLILVNVATLASLGVSASAIAGGISFSNISTVF